MLIQLPNGLLDGADLFNYCEIDELRGKQQNYLANAQLVVNNIGHIPKLLGDMVLSFQTKEGLVWKGDVAKEGIYKIPAGDIETILIKVRENTFGPKYYHEAICTHCGHHHKELLLNLAELALDVMSVTDMLQRPKFVLPKSKHEVELRPQYMNDLFEAMKLNSDNQDEMVTGAIKLCIKRIDDNDKIQAKDVEKIPVTDLHFLNDESEKHKLEGTIDTNIDIACVNCKKDFRVKLNPLTPSFFSRTGRSLSMNI